MTVTMVPLMTNRQLTREQKTSLKTKMRSKLHDEDDPREQGHGHDHKERPSSIFTAFASGLVNYLLMFGLCCAYGMIMFSDDHNKEHRALGVKMNLASAFIIGLLLACTSKVRVAIGGPDLTPVVFLGVFVDTMATAIAGEQNLVYPEATGRRLAAGGPAAEFCIGEHRQDYAEACDTYHAQLRATTVFATAVSSAALGVVFFCLGRFRLSRHVSYLPTSIMEAFLSCVGYKVFMYALKFCNYDPTQFVIAACVGVILYFLKSMHVGNPALVLPVGFVIPLLIFSSVMYFKGKNVDYARDGGWMFPEMKNIEFWKGWADSALMSHQINFKAWLKTLPDLAIMLVVCVLDCLLKISGTETKMPLKVDKDYELQLVGAGNIVTAATGSSVAYAQLKFNVINFGILGNTKDRRGSIVYAILIGGTFFWTIGHINYLPRFFISSLLFFAGSGFVAENLWGSRRYLSFVEWMEVIAILVVFVVTGQLLVAVVVGGFLCGISFILKYARVSAIEGVPMRGGELTVVERRGPLVQRYVRHITNSWLLVVRLKGFVFFASAQSLAAHIVEVLDSERQRGAPAYRRLKFIVFDCTLLDGMDASAAKAMAKLVTEAASVKVRVLWTHMPGHFASELGRRGLFRSEGDVLADLGEAVLHVEELALQYLKRIEHKWVSLHPAFASKQAFTRARFAFEPFTQVFLSNTARIGCPWQYCSRQAMEGHHTLLWRPGETSGMLYLVHSGSVALFERMPSEEGGEQWASPVAIYSKGWFLNRETLMRMPSRYYGVALQDGEVVCWNQEQWWRMATERPLMMSEILKAVMKQQDSDSNNADMRLHGETEHLHGGSAWEQMENAWERQVSVQSSLREPWRSVEAVPGFNTYLPEELTAQLCAIETAGALGLFNPPAAGEDTYLPGMPPTVRMDLVIAFDTYCRVGKSGEGTILWDKVGDALMYAGVFNTELQGESRSALTRDQFMIVGHEAVMAPLSQTHLETVKRIFELSDEDKNGTLSRAELAVLLRQMLTPNINAEEVDGIVTAWRGTDQTTRLDISAFTAVMSMFIRKHTIYWNMLEGFREVLGTENITEADAVTVNDLTGSTHAEITAEEAKEMIWAAGWRTGGFGESDELRWTEFLSAVVLCCHRPAGELPPHPRMPGLPGEVSPSKTSAEESLSAGSSPQAPDTTECDSVVSSIARAAAKVHGRVSQEEESATESTGETETCRANSVARPETFRGRLHMLFEDPNSSLLANIVSMATGVLILVEVLAVVLEPVISGEDSAQSWLEERMWYTFEAFFTAVFTCEYLLRLFVANARGTQTIVGFLINPSNICDLCAILPFYIQLVLSATWTDGGNTKDWFLRIIRFARLALMARVARLAKRSPLAAPVAMVLVVIWGIYFKHIFLDKL